jgi:hypothetical protein
VSTDERPSNGRLRTERTHLSPGEEFVVEVLDANDRPTTHGYLAILDQERGADWSPVYVLAAPWGETKAPSWSPWNAVIMSLAIGLGGPLRYQLPPEIPQGRYRLREANGRSAPVGLEVGPIPT